MKMDHHITDLFGFVAYVQEIKEELFTTDADTLLTIFKNMTKNSPEPLSSQCDNQLSRKEAVAKWQTRRSTTFIMFQPGERKYTVFKHIFH